MVGWTHEQRQTVQLCYAFIQGETDANASNVELKRGHAGPGEIWAAYHGGAAVHQADHLDFNLLLVRLLQQPHHLGDTQPLAVCFSHSHKVVALLQPVSLAAQTAQSEPKELAPAGS